MHSMALKINVSGTDQEALNQVLGKVGYTRQRRKYHCTVGFIEKMIPEEESIPFGQKIVSELQVFIDSLSPFYEVERVAHLFDHVIAFLPTEQSVTSLKEMNAWTFNKVKEISENRWTLNEETLSQNYVPHLTLWRTRRPDHRFKKLEVIATSHPSYHLSEAAYTIF